MSTHRSRRIRCPPSTTRSPTPTKLREAVRGLAHATRSIEDPTAIYPVLGSISSALASLTQSLHQLGDFHDGPSRKQAWMNGDPHAGRAASYQVSWELHRAAEMVHQVAEMRRPGARGRGDDRLRHPRLPVLAPVPRPAARAAGCRCDRLAGRAPAPLGRPRLPGPRATARPQAPQGRRPGADGRGPRGAAYRGEAEGRRRSPPRSARPSPCPGPASPARPRCARPAGSGSRAIRTPPPPSPARTRSSPKADSAAKASSSARTSTPAARSSTTRGSSTPAA